MSQGEENSPLPETTILDDISKFCVKFGNLILGKIIKSVATEFQILKGHFTHMKLFFKITEIETLINITYIVRFLRSTDVSVFYY